ADSAVHHGDELRVPDLGPAGLSPAGDGLRHPHRRLLYGGTGAADGAIHIRLHAVLGAGVWDCGRSGAASAELAPAGSAGAADLWGGIWHRPVDLLSVRH